MKDLDVTSPLSPYGHHIGTPPRDTNLMPPVYINISPNHPQGCLYLNLLFILDLKAHFQPECTARLDRFLTVENGGFRRWVQ